MVVCLCVVAGPFVLADPARSQQRASVETLPPARAGLAPVEWPPFDSLEPAVVDHLREARHAIEQIASSGSDRDVADAYGALGRVFHAYEFLDAAEACYRNASTLRPADATWLHLRAYLYQQSGRLEEAVDLYDKARRSTPSDIAATVHLGETYLGLGRVRDARVEFETVLERLPGVANAGLGEVALREGRHREAIEHLEAALRRIPTATALEYPLAMAYRGLGKTDEARVHLARRGSGSARVADPIVDALQMLVRGERGFVLQGRRAYESGQFQQAADAFRKAVAVAPESAAARVNLGSALAQLGDADGAIEQFETASRLSPGDQTVSDALIRVLLHASRDNDAVAVFTRVRAFGGEDEGSLLKLALALTGRERYGDAVTLLDEAHRAFPDRSSTTTTLARLLAASPDVSLRNGQRALDLAMAVYGREPAPAYGETVAIALAELGRCDEAVDWMRRSIARAEEVKDAAESARLKREAPRYAKHPCRP